MRSLSREEQGRASLIIASLLAARATDSAHSEDRFAAYRGFDSAEHLYEQMRIWGFPEWLIYGKESVPEKKPAQDREHQERRGKRKAKTVRGPAQELPPSKEAAPLFKEALDKLRGDLEFLTYLQTGDRHTPEYVQDGRFIQDTREEAPRWAPDVGGRTRIAGATQAPGNGLPALIAEYLVAGYDPEPLIEKLHPDPDKLDREKLDRILYGDKKNSKPGLFTRVIHAARLIRGADVEARASAGEFDVDEMTTRHRILQMREAGRSDKEIIETLSSEGSPISLGRLKHLAGLKLPGPTP